MKIKLIPVFLISVCLFFTNVFGQSFGQNKVQYQKTDWRFLQSKHFNIYFAKENKGLAEFAADMGEKAYKELSEDLFHNFQKRIPIIIYGSHSQFEETNIILETLPEGVGGFTEMYKTRVVLPFTGSYDDFKHVLHHELAHAVVFNLVYGNLGAMVMRTQFQVPLWFHEGLSEYESLKWDLEADAFMADVAANGRIPSFTQNFGGFMVYKAGQSFFNYLSQVYGRYSIGRFVHRAHRVRDFSKAFESAFGEPLEDVSKEWTRFIKRCYWPEVGRREEIDQFSDQLTTHPKDLSNYNLQPSLSPDGKLVAFFSDRKDYTDIFILSVEDKKIVTRIASQDQSIHIESFHPFHSGITWSPDGTRLLLVTKMRGKEYLSIFDIKKKKQVEKIPIPLETVFSPDWSPDGRSVVFSAIQTGQTDIYLYEFETKKLKRLTADKSCDRHPRFSPDGTRIAFDSNHGKDPLSLRYFKRATYDIYVIRRDGSGARRLTMNPFDDQSPTWSPDGHRIIFTSNRNGFENLYTLMVDSAGPVNPVSDVLGSCQTPHWARTKDHLVFSLFKSGGWDIYLMKKPLEKMKKDPLVPTRYVESLLDTTKSFFPPKKKMTLARKKRMSDKKRKRKKDRVNEPAIMPLPEPDDTPETSLISSVKSEQSTITDTAGPDTLVSDSLHTEALSDTVKKDSLSVVAVKDSTDSTTLFDTLDLPQAMPEDTSIFFQDTLAYKTEKGMYRTYPYRLKFSPDYISFGLVASTYYGGAASGTVVFSDILGNHRFALAGDIFQSSIGTSNLFVNYFFLKHRVDFGVVGFFSRNLLYKSGSSGYETVRYYLNQDFGGAFIVQYPFSLISRIEASLLGLSIEKKGMILTEQQELESSPDPSENVYTIVPKCAFVSDNILWGITGPVNGKRFRVDLTVSPEFKQNDYSYWAVTADFRKYFHLWKKYSFAIRFAGGRSDALGDGLNPLEFKLGGDINWFLTPSINLANFDNSIEDTYFSQLVVPLRGTSYYDYKGTRFLLSNIEFRYPFIKNITLAWPIPIELRYIKGALFYDMGSAWTHTSSWDPGGLSGGWIKLEDLIAGVGFGMRMNLGLFILRVDKAWQTDLSSIIGDPITYISIGAEF